MKTSIKRLLAIVLTVVMALSTVSPSFAYAAGSQGRGLSSKPEGDDGKFVIMAVNEDGWIIRPEYITAASDETTIKEALKASSHTFEGIDNDWVTKIDGQAFNGVRFYDNNEFDLNVPAYNVQKALVFTYLFEGVYSEKYLDLIVKLADYADMDPEEKTFAAVKTAYDNAFEQTPSANSTAGEALYDAIIAAEAEYDAWAAQTKCAVTFSVDKAGAAVTDAAIIVKSAAGISYASAAGNGYLFELRSGSYSFEINKNNDQVTGSFTVAEDETSKQIAASLPDSNWYGEVEISDKSGSNWKALPKEIAEDGYTYTIYVPDTATNGLYPYVVPGESINNDEGRASHDLYGDYISTNGADKGDESVSSNIRSWSSKSTSLAQLVLNGLVERTDVKLKITYTDERGHVQRQFLYLILKRVPTLKALEVSENNGTVLKLVQTANSTKTGFDSAVDEYTVTTVSNELVIKGSTYYKSGTIEYGTFAEGYSIKVNGTDQTENGSVAVPVQNGDVITVSAIGSNGPQKDYKVHVVIVDKATVTLTKEAGVGTHLVTETGSIIQPAATSDTADTFEVAPGTYTWVGTIEQYYHTRDSITVPEAGASATVPTPKKEELLKDLYVKTGTSATAPAYQLHGDEAYDWQDHEYTYVVWDNASGFQVYYEVSDTVKTAKGKFIRGSYLSQYNGTVVAESVKNITSSVSGNVASSNFVRSGEQNNSMICRVEYTADGVNYYQEYFLNTKRKPIAQGITASVMVGDDSQEVGVKQKDDISAPFDYLVDQYASTVPEAAGSMELKVEYSAIDNPSSGDFFVKAKTRDMTEWQTVPREKAAGTAVLTVALDPAKDEEIIDVVLDTGDPDNYINTYSITLTKTPPVTVTFSITPADHSLCVVDNGLGTPVVPKADGTYELMKGGSYTYTVTAYGYVGQQKADYSPSGNETVTIDLAAAPENPAINTDLEADWPYFRYDENNNGATDYKTPVDAEKATLYWAVKAGSGYGSGATGCPIIVGDYIITYAGGSIIKLDRFTGKVVASGTMATSSSFAINSPTYAEGMIFIALNGKVQAFNADTLESLWVYTDPIGGQPNCPIAYSNGYIYTGFWKSETAEANFVCIPITDEDPTQTTEEKNAAWTVKDNGFYWAGAYVGPGESADSSKDYVIVGTDDGDSGYTTGSGNLLSVDPKTGVTIDKYEGVCLGDIRSSISYSDGRYYFTSKGGYFCSIKLNEDGTFDRASLKKLYLDNYSNGSAAPMSTSTPAIYNGRAYVGVSGAGQFSAYSGHNITVIDLATFRIAYTVRTKGYPQTSGLITSAYGDEDGSVYVYFVDNYTPGQLRCIKDKPGQTAPDMTVPESGYDTAYTLFTPYGSQAQYAICSPIADENGFIYFKNDSAYMMMIGPTIDSLEVTEQPAKTTYTIGEEFDPAGMTVVAHYSNGVVRDVTKYVKADEVTFTAEDIGTVPVDITFDLGDNMLTYQDKNGEPGTEYAVPTTFVNATVLEPDPEIVTIDLLGQVEKNTLKKVLLDFEVSSAEAARYGYSKPDAYKYKATMLDAAVALHREIYGEAFENDPTAYLKVSSAGTCTMIFGEATYMNGFHVNDAAPEYPDQPGTGSLWNDTPLKDGDKVRIFKVNGENYGLMESYLMFDKDAYTAHAGGSAAVTVTGDLTFGTMMGMPADITEIEDAVVYAVTDFTDPAGTKVAQATSDEDGVAEFKDLPAGTYHLVVGEYENDYEEDCFSTPYATLTVTDHTWTETSVTVPTFDEEGSRICTCSECGETKTEPIGKLGFTVTVDGEAVPADMITITADGYDASYEDWQTGNKVENLIPLAVVTIPYSASEVTVTLNDAFNTYCTYYYTAQPDETGYTQFIGNTEWGEYDPDRWMYVAEAGTPYAAAIAAGQVIRIQTEYDANWTSYNLYAIAIEREPLELAVDRSQAGMIKPADTAYLTDDTTVILPMQNANYDQAFVGDGRNIVESKVIDLSSDNTFTLTIPGLETEFMAAFKSTSSGKWFNKRITVSKTNATLVMIDDKADYSGVEAALAAVPADLSIYTEESVAAVTAAVEAATESLNKKVNSVEQATVDALAQAIIDAVAGLVSAESTVRLRSAHLSLEGKISINFKVQAPDAGYVAKLYYEKAGFEQVAEVPLDDDHFVADPENYDYYLVTYSEVPAKEMNQLLRIKVFDANGNQVQMKISSGYIDQFDYSVATWCTNKINAANPVERDVMIAKAMLNYGHYSQLALKYNDGREDRPDNMPAAWLESEMSSVVADPAYNRIVDGGKELGAKSFILTLESDTLIKLLLSRQVSVKIDGEAVALAPEKDANGNDVWAAYSAGVAAKRLHELKPFELTEGENSATMYYGCLSWANSKLANGNEDDQNLARAMYLYNAAARSYFGY